MERPSVPGCLCFRLRYRGLVLGWSWARVEQVTDSTIAVASCQSVRRVADLGIRGFKRAASYCFTRDGVLCDARVEDSFGGKAVFAWRDQCLVTEMGQVVSATPVDWVAEPNNFALAALQLSLTDVHREGGPEGKAEGEASWPRTALIPDGAKIVPLTFHRSDGLFRNDWGEVYRLDADGMVQAVTLASADTDCVRVNRAYPTWGEALPQRRLTYAPDPTLRISEMKIDTASYKAEATLARPMDDGAIQAVCLFIGGTGVYSRHGFAGQIDIGTHQLLDGLARQGIATLRYDKFNARYASVAEAQASQDFEGLCDDAERWLDLLAERGWCRAAPLVIIGHSLGGLVGLRLAARRRDIAAVITLNAPGRPLRQVIGDQQNWAMAALDISGEAAGKAESLTAEAIRLIEAPDPVDPGDVSPALWSILPNRRLYRGLLDLDPGCLANDCRCPVLIVQGDADIQVTPEDATRLYEAAGRAGDRSIALWHAAGLDHHLKRATQRAHGAGALYAYSDRRRRVPVSFIRQLVRRIGRITIPGSCPAGRRERAEPGMGLKSLPPR